MIEHADQFAFDLDPGGRIGWDFVIETALKLRLLLQHEGFESWPDVRAARACM